MKHDRGFVVAEWMAALAALLVPFLILLGSLASWLEAKTTAEIAAQEAARAVVLGAVLPDGVAAGQRAAALVLHDRGCHDCRLSIDHPGSESEFVRGETLVATVTARAPLLSIPVLGIEVGAIDFSARHAFRVDDYRSLP